MAELLVQTFAGRPIPLGEMNILDKTGHSKKTWDSHNADEVADARRTFTDLRAKGFLAYTVKKDGTQGEQITEFNPELESIIMSPPVRGG